MRDATNAPDFAFRLDREGSLSFTLGNARLALSVDAAYELQYQLAEMLAFVETFEDLESEGAPPCFETPNVIAFENRSRRKAP